MKNILIISSLVAALAASAPQANANSVSADANDAQMARTLSVTGQIAVANVGDHIHAGSFQIWVTSQLGQPDRVLANGTWLYGNRQLENSAVGGTLAISFEHGRVSAMRLLSPATVTALLHPAKPAGLLLAAR